MDLKTRMLFCCVFPLLYGAEAWNLKQYLKKRHLMCRLSVSWLLPWTNRITNRNVLQIIDNVCKALNIIKKRKLEYLRQHIRSTLRSRKRSTIKLIFKLFEAAMKLIPKTPAKKYHLDDLLITSPFCR